MPAQEKPFLWPPHAPAISGFRLSGTHPGGVFLHGFRSHCDGEKARALARHAADSGRSWLRYTQRHCAPSSGTFEHFTIGRAICDAVAILDFFQQPVVLIGSSLGALVALEAARQRSNLVAGLLLLAPAVRFFERYFLSLPQHEIEQWRKRGTKTFPDSYEGGMFTLGFTFFSDAEKHRAPGPWNFDFPVSILHGQNDELLPPQDSIDLEQMIRSPIIDLYVVPGGDHRLTDAIPLICRKLDALWQGARP